ncbi:Inner membrane protein YrbG, predicted calcium/sodium:proton antiporter [Thermogutta terrifontis]|uniref:Inner membrane protein YrbG, predicted calcium/sodium:proton antiporter n=1 Tax=Thermogutta terrifontis TaxID=1331910 RepID=A0A286RB58_9BACT|nr:PGPGW domain-containing protein [Thermogutta terrifontis]ASV73192.1 Inner membrane protein YrbG, predicted calcium/sodium:proton antiporter [Thermogutta terrifontis]
MWTPLQNSLAGKESPHIEFTPEGQPTAALEDLLASLSWLDRVLLRIGIRWVRRIVITIVGLTLLLVGVIMIVAPGPATLVIPMGLAILGLEYAWARRLLKRLKGYVDAGLTQGSAMLGWDKKTTAAPTTSPQECSASPSHNPPSSTSPEKAS